MDERTFVARLLEVVPELRSEYEEHIEDNDELLPHVFMGAVTRFAIAKTVEGRNQPALQRLLAFLEEQANSGSDSIRELIGVSFVENLTGENTALNAMLPMLGPALRKEVKTILGV